MEHQDVQETIRKFIYQNILRGAQVTLDAHTPLLELGILTSLSTMRLLGFIRERFGVEVPMSDMIGDNFRDLASITTLLSGLALPEVDDVGQ